MSTRRVWTRAKRHRMLAAAFAAGRQPSASSSTISRRLIRHGRRHEGPQFPRGAHRPAHARSLRTVLAGARHPSHTARFPIGTMGMTARPNHHRSSPSRGHSGISEARPAPLRVTRSARRPRRQRQARKTTRRARRAIMRLFVQARGCGAAPHWLGSTSMPSTLVVYSSTMRRGPR